jgi:membrane associated rhomboid family serine protease
MSGTTQETSKASGPPPLSWRSATAVLIVLNLVVYLAERRFALPDNLALSLRGLAGGAWWEFITYQFLHGGWLHLGFNLLFLHSLGPVLEDTIGAKRFTLLYLGSGAFGGAVHLMGALLSPRIFGHPVVGASAGLCGLLAALCAIYAEEPMELRLLFLIPVVMRAKFLLLGTALMSMAGTVLPFGNVAHLAHLGGLVGGLLCLNFMDVKPLEFEPPPASPPGR